MRRKLFESIFFIFLFSSSAYSSNPITRFPDAVTSGFDWRGLAILSAGFATSAAYVQSDRSTLNSVQKHNYVSRSLLDASEPFGTGVPNAVILGMQYYYNSDDAATHLDALVYTLVTTSLLKEAVNRRRPNGGSHSYPSGHAAGAFATATNLAYNMGWVAAAIAYPIAFIVGLERVKDNYHWPSDVAAGAAIGIFWGRATALNKSLRESGLGAFYPDIQPDYKGIKWVAEF